MIIEIQKKIILTPEIELTRKTFHQKKIIFTNGCFDILHLGHLTYLYEAKQLGDILWIGLNSDQSVKKLKGENRPINFETDRAIMLASLFFVDYVSIFSEETPLNLISKIKPNIHVKGGDYNKEKLPEYQLVKSFGGEVIILPFVEGKSTTKLIEKINSKISLN